VAGVSVRDLSSRYGTLGRMALQRHKDNHLPQTLVKAHEEEDVRHALDVVKQLKAINGAAITILRDARAQGDSDVALKAIDRIHRQIELQAKLLGELDDRPQVNVLISPEWQALRGAILAALAPFPDARVAVANRISQMERVQ
jgi:hypothetical protein